MIHLCGKKLPQLTVCFLQLCLLHGSVLIYAVTMRPASPKSNMVFNVVRRRLTQIISRCEGFGFKQQLPLNIRCLNYLESVRSLCERAFKEQI